MGLLRKPPLVTTRKTREEEEEEEERNQQHRVIIVWSLATSKRVLGENGADAVYAIFLETLNAYGLGIFAMGVQNNVLVRRFYGTEVEYTVTTGRDA